MGVEFNVKEESLRGEGRKSDEGAGGFSSGGGVDNRLTSTRAAAAAAAAAAKSLQSCPTL